MAVNPYGRNTWRGVTLNNRTLEMFEITELRAISFSPLELSQGSYSSSVSQSGGTHDGGGALDVRVVSLSTAQRDKVVLELRRTGFAAWLRTPSQGNWPYHIHAVAIGDRELSSAAAFQVAEYKAGRNGLANRGPDDGPDVAWTEYRQDIDLSYYGPAGKNGQGGWDEADKQWFFDNCGWGKNITDGRGLLRNADKLLSMVHENGFQAEDAAIAATAKAVDAQVAANAAGVSAGQAKDAAEGARLAAVAAQQAVQALEARLFPPA